MFESVLQLSVKCTTIKKRLKTTVETIDISYVAVTSAQAFSAHILLSQEKTLHYIRFFAHRLLKS